MKKYVYTLAIGWLLSGCASLTRSQVAAVNQFGSVTRDFSAYPSALMTSLADIRQRRGIYFATSLSDPKLHVAELDSIHAQRAFDYRVSEKTDVTFKILDKYAQSLTLLSSDKFATDLSKEASGLGTDLDKLIKLNNAIDGAPKVPTGIGGAVGELLALGGKPFVRTRQAAEVRKFVSQADTLVATMTANLLEFVQSTTLNELIKNEEVMLGKNYLSFVRQTPKPTVENATGYLTLRDDLATVKALRQQTAAALLDYRKTHRKILQELQTKKPLKVMLTELLDLTQDIIDLKQTLQKIKAAK